MENIESYSEYFVEQLQNYRENNNPKALYEPINYIMNLGGKRLRPVICLMGCEMFGGDIKNAIKPAVGIEAFHNFTLMHDDIMDAAPIRRGKKSVHYKYGTNSAILSGDALLIRSYQYFEDLEPALFKNVIQLFSKTALQICEGQQYDMNFAEQKEITIDEYFEMITLKTGVLSACALKIGALIANANEKEAENLYNFGKHVGIAFQLMDDYLDVFGNANLIGKKHGGDVFENKKTILYLKALEKAVGKEKEELLFWYGMKTDNIDKLYSVEKLFRTLDVGSDVKELISFHTNRGLKYLELIDLPKERKEPLAKMTSLLPQRST